MTAPAMTTSELRQRVEVGMAWLDARHPGWDELIDVATLDVASPCNCLLGQALGSWDLHTLGMDVDQLAACGFDASSSHDDMAEEYAALTELWRSAVLARRAGVSGRG
ncbi:hypothetical protein [Micromonospora sp. NPDC023633]|uniref:hypothetical protein n=1 Tax=Micromonospora sp. NPDC023633 TaxID=3154320 RepID=UPI0034001512